jgi:hypothetical protein
VLLANIMARPDTPKMPLATTLSLIWASSSNFPAQFFSAVRTPAGRPVRLPTTGRVPQDGLPLSHDMPSAE